MHTHLVGQSPAHLRIVKQLPVFAASTAPVLILGETGTGKEVTARALHDLGPRASQPFVALNTAAMPADLLESELFGHARGAFTGAHREHAGLVAAANGGTLFLDEIGDMDPALQAKILRFADRGEYRPVGSTRTLTSDVRLITATHRPLADLARTGLFREDLYYRISVLSLALAPLRARMDDLPLLAAHLLRTAAEDAKRPAAVLSPAAFEKLITHRWPGNIRELKNVLTRATILHAGPMIGPDDIDTPVAQDNTAIPLSIRPLRETENEAIQHALAQCNGNVLRAAALLQVAPSTLYRRVPRTASGTTTH